MKSLPTIPLIAVILILAGTDLLLDRTGVLYLTWWQLGGAISAVQGLLVILYGIRDGKAGGVINGALLVILGVIFLIPDWWKQVNWPEVNEAIRTYWPLLIIWLGVHILFKSFEKRKKSDPT
ncbi:MAG: hypothetical protein HUU10_02570 [Bacteroidetes bacterium]|nr:hypothetical protein [Bacteroidota bacterium]